MRYLACNIASQSQSKSHNQNQKTDFNGKKSAYIERQPEQLWYPGIDGRYGRGAVYAQPREIGRAHV